MDTVLQSELERIQFGNFTFTPALRLLTTSSDERKEMSSELSAILHNLAAVKGTIVTKESLYQNICARRNYRPEPKIVDVQICNLRRVLDRLSPKGGNHITTVWGEGYFLSNDTQNLKYALQAVRGTRNKGLLQRLSDVYLGAA